MFTTVSAFEHFAVIGNVLVVYCWEVVRSFL